MGPVHAARRDHTRYTSLKGLVLLIVKVFNSIRDLKCYTGRCVSNFKADAFEEAKQRMLITEEMQPTGDVRAKQALANILTEKNEVEALTKASVMGMAVGPSAEY